MLWNGGVVMKGSTVVFCRFVRFLRLLFFLQHFKPSSPRQQRVKLNAIVGGLLTQSEAIVIAQVEMLMNMYKSLKKYIALG